MFHTPHDALICAPEQQALKRLALLVIARALKVEPDQAKQVLVIAHRKPIARQLGAFLNRSLKVFSARIAVLVEPSDISRYPSSSIDSLEVVVMTPKLGSVMPVSFYQSRALTILMDLHNVNQDYQQVINTILQNHSTTRLIAFSSPLMDPSSLSSWLMIDESNGQAFMENYSSEPDLLCFNICSIQTSMSCGLSAARPVFSI